MCLLFSRPHKLANGINPGLLLDCILDFTVCVVLDKCLYPHLVFESSSPQIVREVESKNFACVPLSSLLATWWLVQESGQLMLLRNSNHELCRISMAFENFDSKAAERERGFSA